MEIRRLDMEAYRRHFPSSGFTVFQRSEVLSVLDEYAESDLELYGAFKGQEAVGLIPVFVTDYAVGRTVCSPPVSRGIPHMGPVFMPTSPKQRKRERGNAEFLRGVVDALEDDPRLTVFRVLCRPDYTDPRPYAWSDQRITPYFTYVLDVGDRSTEDLLAGFTRDLRSEIRKSRDLDMEISVEDDGAAARVGADVAERYAEQGESTAVTPGFVEDVVSALGHRARTYVARDPAGEYLGGIVVLYADDTAYFWQGGVAGNYEGVSVNSALHWEILTDIATDPPVDSVDRYDLVGANTERLSEYKAKFGGDLVPYYLAESDGPGMGVAKRAYEVMRT
ncbi:GNAT family N-acetyltransferase [Halobacteriales archaeon QS_8_69_26]|nr:MAG: GNAT family N-acetyltransferase [Halobacteriales archaeon QS_8_69_26]